MVELESVIHLRCENRFVISAYFSNRSGGLFLIDDHSCWRQGTFTIFKLQLARAFPVPLDSVHLSLVR